MTPTRLTVHVSASSDSALDRVKGWVAAVGGLIVDARWFGNQMLTVTVELTVDELWALVDRVGLGRVTDATLQDARGQLGGLAEDADVVCRLAVVLVHDEPDRARVVPAVPGG